MCKRDETYSPSMRYLMQRRILSFPVILFVLSAGVAGCTFGGQATTTLPTLPATIVPATTAALATSAIAATDAATTLPAIVPTAVSVASTVATAIVAAPAVAATVIPATNVPTKISAAQPTTAVPKATTTAAPTKAPVVPATALPATKVPVTSVPATVAPAATKVPAAAVTQATVAAVVSTAATAGASVANTTGGALRVLAYDPVAKQIAWIAANGQPQTIAAGAASRNELCGADPTGTRLLLFHGDISGKTTLLNTADNSQPQPINDSNNSLACDLSGHTVFSPDGSRLAYLQYATTPDSSNDYINGTLHILKMPEGTELAKFDGVNAFSLQNDGALMLKFIANSKGTADRADLTWWDATASKEQTLESGFASMDNCFFASAQVVRVADKVYASLGERCTKPNSSAYRVRRTDFNSGKGGNSTDFVPKTATGGRYYLNTNLNQLIVLPVSNFLLIAVPNGQTNDVSDLSLIALDSGKVTPVIQKVVIDVYKSPLPRRFLLNPQGTQLAFITRNGNNGETLYTYDLTRPDSAPAAVTDDKRSNKVNGVAWNQAGDRIVYITSGDDAALSYFQVATGNKQLVQRGAFQGLALSPDGNTVATSEQVQTAQAPQSDLRNNLVTFSLADNSKTPLVSSAKGAAAVLPLAVR